MSDDIVGFNALIEGDSGTGKTHSIGTLEATGLEVFVLFLESGQETLYGYFTDKGKALPDSFHVHRLRSTSASFKELLDSAKKTNTLPHKTLSEMMDPMRTKYDFYLNILDALNNFRDQRTGECFGAVDEWDTNRVLVVDGLSGINRAAMQLVIGGKAVRSQAEWGQAQFYVEELVHKLCNGCRCHFVLIAHQELEQDPLGGGSKKTVSTLGKALAPKIPQLFSDVVLAVKQGDKFMWSTADTSCALKNRNLPLAGNLPPDFGPMYLKWKTRMNHGD